jgi:hypothetical protein
MSRVESPRDPADGCRQNVRVFLIISTIMSILIVSCQTWFYPWRSWVTARLEIPNSSWEVVREWHGSGGFDTGMTVIVARNRASGKVVRIADVEGYSDVELSLDAKGRVIVALPAPIELSKRDDSFDSVEVVYRFHADDAVDIDGYSLWLDHHDDPRAVAWCRSKGWSRFYCEPRS